MMIPGIMAQQRVVTGGPADPASLVGTVATLNDFTGSNFTVSVPAGAQTGDTLIAVLRCRGDRSFTVPGGWTAETNGAGVGTDPSISVNTKIYILYKAFAGETSLTFVQSTSAAGLFALIVVRGVVGGISKASNSNNTSRTPINAQSMMLAIGTTSSTENTNPTWSAPFTPPEASYIWSSSIPHFYCVTISDHSSGGTSSVSASYLWSSTAGGANYIWLAEILPPS